MLVGILKKDYGIVVKLDGSEIANWGPALRKRADQP